MIIRIFRVNIKPELREQFEPLFETNSTASVRGAEGFISVSIGKPTCWAPNEYVMISTWKDEGAIKAYAGESWNSPHIPEGMEKFVVECWVHHYVSF